MRTTGIRFLDYDVRVGKNLVDDNEFLFSHYCNLIVDGAENYVLQYDLRDASVDGSPVEAKKVVPYTVDEGDGFTSYHELYTDEVVTTGDMLLQGGQVTLIDCDAKRKDLDGGGRIEGAISFENSKVAGTDRTLKVDRTDTIAREINLSATSGTNTLEVTEGNTASFGTLSGTGELDKTGLGTAEVTGALTLQGAIRVHEGSFVFGKDATISGSVSLTVDGGVMKGSGTFAGVIVDNGGTLIVGNSPGRQEYLGDLSVNLGEIVFGVSGWDTAADEDNVGWSSGTYSNVVMNGNSLTLGGDSKIRFGVGNDALAALLGSDSGTAFSMTIATGIGNGDYFKSGVLDQLAAQTIFYVTDELGAVITNDAGLNAGDSLNTRITDLRYELVDNTQLCVSGVYWAAPPAPVPEPATATLGLLALAGLCARRRK
ncbi:MAG: PEP-CTERM sorting domain-containing protein [Akkermansia sp.]|nr:PEP-CTERM sorting domain-containing protein [Akkermansia sp.]